MAQRPNLETMKTYISNIPEITLRRIPTDFKKVKIKNSKEAEQFARQFYFDDLTIYESFFLILLNSCNNTIGYVKISQGGVAGTVVDTKLIAKYCIDTLAKGIIMVHNHPSGSPKPSNEDKNITKQVISVLNLFDCQVLDHIILSEDSFFSFSDDGIL
jgi:DNA repair protein RadC